MGTIRRRSLGQATRCLLCAALVACTGGQPRRVGVPSDTEEGSDSIPPDHSTPADSSVDSDPSDTSPPVDTAPPELVACDKPGFASAPTSWTIPSLLADGRRLVYSSFLSASSCAESGDRVVAQLQDVDGDGRRDLLLGDLCDDEVIGTTAWRVHLSTGVAFAADPLDLPIPAEAAGLRVVGAGALTAACEDSTRTRAAHFLDHDGDGRMDLLIVDDCDLQGVGTTHWLRARGTGTGFLPIEPIALPAVPATVADPFRLLNGKDSRACDLGYTRFTLRPHATGSQLVLTEACNADDPGRTAWWTWPLGPTGYTGSPTPLSLPADLAAVYDLTAWIGDVNGCSPVRNDHLERLDLDGDGDLDLVMGARCNDATSGLDHLSWWPREPGGFGSQRSWTFPSELAQAGVAPLRYLSGQLPFCSAIGTYVNAFVGDLNHDRSSDLLVTAVCDNTSSVGKDRWLLYAADGTGFSSPPLDVPLPSLGSGMPSPRSAFNYNQTCLDRPGSGSLFSQLLDLDGDGMLDLVVTSLCDDPDVGVTRWDVYRGICRP